ncbi:sugar transferase [Salinicoccus albus]|uniref:sugar transferase n=1 Tax=Salinicoccus albus TaxID=418756 RepID=UPI00037AAEBD|nr:sugar transferase [Salinicoccus albus]
MKRLFDLAAAVLLLILLLPVMAVTAILVHRELGAPLLFRQIRPGRNGECFELYKFRTMTDETDAFGKLLPDTLRLRPTGQMIRKYSLDELPQLINVIKGDLSLVGPRPLLTEYLPLYNTRQMKRHEVRPGITGWAQVNGRNTLPWPEKFEMDVWYIENHTFRLDVKILYMTVRKVLQSEGISQEGESTVQAFTGNKGKMDEIYVISGKMESDPEMKRNSIGK